MTPRRFLAGLLVACGLALFGVGARATACSAWEHRWLTLRQTLSHDPTVSLLTMWKVWYETSFGKEAPPFGSYPEASPSLPLPPAPEDTDPPATASAPTAAIGNRVLAYSPDFEEMNTWKVDEALLPHVLLRLEHTERAIVRWTELDSAGQVVDIGETPILHGWTQTMLLDGCVVPIVQFQRITSSTRSADLFRLLEALLPPTPSPSPASGTETPEVGPPDK
ncbi:MAG: hypothetical protein GX442_08125 [Candidatus Riflebacteria bacterium]|nr:hypothetical protein [Candidatus Riflebacteria bacterium]